MVKKPIPTIDADGEAQEILREIREQAAWCDKLAAKVEDAKSVLKDAREEFETARDHLTALCRAKDADQPLFDSAET